MIIRVPEDAGRSYERIQYPAGELQVRISAPVLKALHESKAVTVLCRQAHQHLMELALLAEALHFELQYGKLYIPTTLVLPYLPYSRADRRFVEGDCHGLKTFSDIVDSMHFSHVRTLDVHSYRAAKYVSRLQDVSARPFVAKAIADICDKGGHPVVLLPDEGAKRYGLDGALQCHKKRDAATGKLSGFQVPELPDEHDVLIVDDICDGGGIFIGLAEEIFRACEEWDSLGESIPGTEESRPKLYLYVTHGIFSKGLIKLGKYFEKIYTTNAYQNYDGWSPDGWRIGSTEARRKLEVFDCEPELLGGVDAKSK